MDRKAAINFVELMHEMIKYIISYQEDSSIEDSISISHCKEDLIELLVNSNYSGF